jgi:hypothetical protein
MSLNRDYTASDVKRYRDDNGVSLLEAKQEFEQRFLIRTVQEARWSNDIDLLGLVVEELVAKMRFDR